jgi:serine/threonine protein kinase
VRPLPAQRAPESAPNFTIGEKIGEGSSAVVHAGEHYGSPAAVMVMKTKCQPEIHISSRLSLLSVQSLKEEIEIAKKLRHPNIVQLFDSNQRDGFPCVLMELFSNGSFWSMLIREKRTPALTLKQKTYILTGASRGMAFLHSRKPPLIHRDLRSAKILVDQSLNAKVSIFGVNQRQRDAEMVREESGYYGSKASSIPYMAPELLKRKIMARR